MCSSKVTKTHFFAYGSINFLMLKTAWHLYAYLQDLKLARPEALTLEFTRSLTY